MDMVIISVSIPVSDVFRGYAKKSLGLSAGKIQSCVIALFQTVKV